MIAHSLVTHDGRRLVSCHGEDGAERFKLVPEAELPPGTPPARKWTIYVLKATHTDIGLHNPPYVQRHGAVKRIEEAARLIDADTRADDDPAAALGAKVSRRVFLPSDAKRIDIEDAIEHARNLFNENRWFRFGYLAFPFDVPGGAFAAHLNGTVVRPYEDCHPMTTDAYCAVRDWCAVENGDFGVALMMRDSTLTEFGEIHPDKTCYTGRPPEGKTGIYPYLFNDWLQMHQPDGDSMNFTFRFAITSYAGDWAQGDVPRLCEDWLDPCAAWMREQGVPRVVRDSVGDPPPDWTGLIEKPRAGHGEKDGQMYLLWGAEMSPGFSHYELYRDGEFLANVENEAPDGIPYRVARYEDLGLPSHSRHEYRLRKVWKDGRKDPLGEPFSGLTRQPGKRDAG